MASIDLSQYNLVFDDEFNSLNLNSASNPKGTWDTTYAWGGRTLSSNGEQQLYIDPGYNNLGVSPFSVQNGILTISAQPASAAVKAADGNLPYTSGMLTTNDSFSQTYGYFEMKAQLPGGKGLWPEFWLLNTDGKWPPEIDVMEMLGNQPTTDYTTLHTGTGNTSLGKANTVADTTTGSHTYGVDWEPTTTTFYFDGQAQFSAPTPADMHSPMYMLANLAVGGSWPGSPDGSTKFPADMNIDYIRAYASHNTIAGVNSSAAAVHGAAPGAAVDGTASAANPALVPAPAASATPAPAPTTPAVDTSTTKAPIDFNAMIAAKLGAGAPALPQANHHADTMLSSLWHSASHANPVVDHWG